MNEKPNLRTQSEEFNTSEDLNLRKKKSEPVQVIFRSDEAERKTEIAVGPFYYLNGFIDSELDPIETVEPIDGMYDGNMSHFRLAALKNREPYQKYYRHHAYDYFPRGRLVYDGKKRRLIIYADKCIRQSEKAKIDIIYALVPDGVKFQWRADAHYKCHTCNSGFVDID